MSLATEPAWTREIDGAVYTIKIAGEHTLRIWRANEEIGTFEMRGSTVDGPVIYAGLSREARSVAHKFVQDYMLERRSV